MMSRSTTKVRFGRMRSVALILAAMFATLILAISGATSASAATTTYTYWDNEPVVNGTSVSFDSYVGASQRTSVHNLGICVRDANDANVDLPRYNNGGWVTIPKYPAGFNLKATGEFEPGTYTFGTCFQPSYSNGWYGSLHFSNIDSFTVENPVSGPSDDEELTSAPVGNVGGATQKWAVDFDQDAEAGTIGINGTSYADRLFLTPDGQRGTDNIGVYEGSRNVSVHDGMLDLAVQPTVDGSDISGAQVRFLNDVNGAWAYSGGRFSIRMKTTINEDAPYGLAALLWPDNNVWGEGEIDYPEGVFGGDADLNQHKLSPNDPGEKSIMASVPDGLQDWHVYTIDWKPGQSVTYYVDGELLATETDPANIPTTEHNWIVQALSLTDQDLPPGAVGHVLVDWATTYSYNG